MQPVGRHVISKNGSRNAIIDAAAFASKNPWNAANYHEEEVDGKKAF